MARDLLEELFVLRDQQRTQRQDAVWVVDGDKVEWEINRQGKMKWYLHPSISTTVIKSLLVFIQEIPPGSRSGKQKHQGGMPHYVLEGRGYTVIDGVRYDWEEGDTVVLPVKPEGVVYQHFNGDPGQRVLFIAAFPNMTESLGVDLGAGLEQLENCPEYRG